MNCPACQEQLNDNLNSTEFLNKKWFSCLKCKVSIDYFGHGKIGWAVWKWNLNLRSIEWQVDALKSKDETLTEWVRRIKLEAFI